MADDEIDECPQSNLKMGMAHEISACHALKDAVISRHVAFLDPVSLLCKNLSGLGFELIVFQLIIGSLLFVIMIGNAWLLALRNSQHRRL